MDGDACRCNRATNAFKSQRDRSQRPGQSGSGERPDMPDKPLQPLITVRLRTRRAAFAIALVGVMVMSLLPVDVQLPTTGWDKTNHLLGFSVLAVLGCWSYPARSAIVLAGLLAYGGLIEVLQSFTIDHLAESGDLLADALGLLLGWSAGQAANAAARRLGRR